MKRYGWMVVAMVALAACSDSHARTPGSQTHFVTCDEDRDCSALGDGFACSDGRCREVEMNVDSVANDSGMGRGTGTGTNMSMGMPDSGTARDTAVVVLDSGNDSATSMDVTELCDGSDGIRLGMWMSGGFISPDWQFQHPFGAYFAFIDGHCDYYASWSAMLGIRSGSVLPTEVGRLALDVGWDQIDAFSTHIDQSCPDAGGSVISNGKHAYGCSCGCDEDSPPDLAESEPQSRTWIERLATDQGQPLSGPLRAAAIEFTGGIPPGGMQTWPLANAPISDIVVQEIELNGATVGVLFTEQADVDALRLLRRNALAASPDAQRIIVGDGDKLYSVYMRDELPADVDTAVRAFQMASYASQMH